MIRGPEIPLVRRFPALARVPRARLGLFPTPVVPVGELSSHLWIKRDDLCGNPMGGNKVRALEFLLGDLAANESVVTVGSVGSTHALAVATYGKRIGVRVTVARWRQVMNPMAHLVADRIARDVRRDRAPTFRSPVVAYAWALRERLRGARWIDGSRPLDPAVGMARFMSRLTSRQGSSSSPDMMSAGTSMRAISAVRS